MTKFRELCRLYLFSAVLIFFFQGIAGDDLLFHSDLFSYAYFTTGLILCGFVLLTGAYAIGVRILGRDPAKIWRGIERITLILIFGGFLFFSMSVLGIVPRKFYFYVVLLVAVLTVARWLVWRTKDVRSVGLRMESLSVVTMMLGLGFFGIAVGAIRLVTPRSTSGFECGAKHAILVVIDGFPSQVLRTYSSGTEETEFDRAIRDAWVFANARTANVYTAGFFSTLYLGRTDIPYWLRHKATKEINLIRKLQESGVSTRWFSFHPGGIPETTAITSYSGLRSVLLTENWNWIPAGLGINYHTFSALMRKRMRTIADGAVRLMNGVTNEDDVWNNVFFQIRELRAMCLPSFLIVHLPYMKHLVQTVGESDGEKDEIDQFYWRARRNDYRYEAVDETIVEKIRIQYREMAGEHGKRIHNLIVLLRQINALDDTLIVVTADHGTILGKNKVWYGYHEDEEVARVPLVIFRRGVSGVDERLVGTTDLTETFIDYFGVKSWHSKGGVSLLGGDEREYVSVLTKASDKYKEHFVSVYEESKKFVVNIHPEGKGESWWGMVDGYELLKKQFPIEPENPIWEKISEVLRDYALQPVDVHEKYWDLLNRKGRS